MSTEETGEEEAKEVESSKSSGSEESKEEEETSQIELPAGLSIPPAITTTKTKVIGFGDYDIEDIMSSDSYSKNIPTIKAGITAVEFVVKEIALKSVLAIRNYFEFYSETKHKSLYQEKEDGGTTEMKRMQSRVI